MLAERYISCIEDQHPGPRSLPPHGASFTGTPVFLTLSCDTMKIELNLEVCDIQLFCGIKGNVHEINPLDLCVFAYEDNFLWTCTPRKSSLLILLLHTFQIAVVVSHSSHIFHVAYSSYPPYTLMLILTKSEYDISNFSPEVTSFHYICVHQVSI